MLVEILAGVQIYKKLRKFRKRLARDAKNLAHNQDVLRAQVEGVWSLQQKQIEILNDVVRRLDQLEAAPGIEAGGIFGSGPIPL